MSSLEDRLTVEGREVAARGRGGAETDAAWRALQDGQPHVARPERGRPNRAWIATAAAGLLVVGAIASTLFLGGNDSDHGVGAPATATEVVPTAEPDPLVDDSTNPTSPGSTPEPETGSESSAPPDTGTESFPPGRPCTYTDPARRPITVSRALTCPNGTEVWVDGVVVVTSDGTFLCDHLSGSEAAPCDGASLKLIGLTRDGNGGYTGVTEDGRLLIASPAIGVLPSEIPLDSTPRVPPAT